MILNLRFLIPDDCVCYSQHLKNVFFLLMKNVEVFNVIFHITTASLEIQTPEVWENCSGLT